MKAVTWLFLALSFLACNHPPRAEFEHRTLRPYPPLFGPGDPLWTPQPHRDRPLRVAVTPDGRKAYVTLQGYEDQPGHEVSVVDLQTRSVLKRLSVGSSPTGVAVHPSGRFVVVTNRFSNWASVIDTATDQVTQDVPADYYLIDVVFTPDGRRAYFTNRWKNHVVRWDVSVTGDRFEVLNHRSSVLPASTHPRDVAVSADGTRLAVAGLDGLRVTLYELPSERRITEVNLRAPVNDVVFAGPWLIALTQGPGDGHPPLLGPDFDEDGRPGDSTANTNFQDQQNDIVVLRASDGAVVWRYTSDTICCRDFRDVSPDDPELGRFLPPRELWIVRGAVPEAAAVCGHPTAPWLYVGYLGSSEIDTFQIDLGTGSLRPAGHGSISFGPTSLACVGEQAVVVTSLAESLELVRPNGERDGTITVGDQSGGPFPATDAEIGELVNIVTAPFTVDGDQSCVMCHREFGNVEKAFSMPLQRYPEGTRNTMPHRGLADTRPWFFETAMDENNFFPVLNEFARSENFCCTDPSLWNNQRPAPPDCESHPPPICASRPWPRNFPTRNAFFLSQAQRVLGRARTFGDAFDAPLNFQGLTRALGLSLLMRSRLLPNPNPSDTPAVRRGRALFFSPSTGCAGCHSGSGFAASVDQGPDTRLHFGPVVTPNRSPDGRNLDLVSDGFRSTFPDTVQDGDTIEFGAPTLRNIWAHSNLFLHDGRARSLREVLATPGHPVLKPGERGFNELDGIPNSHGATSHLSPQQIEDLIAYLLSL